MELSTLHIGDSGRVLSVETENAGLRHRLLALGFVPGSEVRALRRAPFADPTEYEVRGTRVSLRRTEAQLISIAPLSAAS